MLNARPIEWVAFVGRASYLGLCTGGDQAQMSPSARDQLLCNCSNKDARSDYMKYLSQKVMIALQVIIILGDIIVLM